MDIVPIQLSLTAGDLITLWAPRWRDDDDEWEAFLGDEDSVYGFPDAAVLAAFVRTATDHDLIDHPSWPLVHQLTAAEFVPEEAHCYDVVGAPEIVADEPDTWTVTELAGIVALVRSLADTCGLDAVHDVLNAAEGFALLERGNWSFGGREGTKHWEELGETIARRWDEVIDALDQLVRTPDVDEAALIEARVELAMQNGEPPQQATDNPDQAVAATNGDLAREPVTVSPSTGGAPRGEALRFWEEVGIDPIMISYEHSEFYTLRCYLDDKPLFLGSKGRIDVLPSPDELARYLAGAGAEGHDLDTTATWPEVVERAQAGELVVEVDPQNTYVLTGLAEDLSDGPLAVDPNQLDLAVELLLDVGTWARDESAELALAPSQSLGWLTNYVLRPDPTRLAPSPPFDAEVARWNMLVNDVLSRLRRR